MKIKLPCRRLKPHLVVGLLCSFCRGHVVCLTETDWGYDDEGCNYGWIGDWTCVECDRWLSYGDGGTVPDLNTEDGRTHAMIRGDDVY
jgi:hypothetical protein